MAEYNKAFADETLEDLIAGEFERPEYSFDVDPGFAKPPVLEIVRFVSDFNDKDKQEKIAKYCILGKTVKLLVNGKQFGSGFIINDLNAPWDLFPEFTEHPLALELLFDITAAHVLKNSKLSQKSVPKATVETLGTTEQNVL